MICRNMFYKLILLYLLSVSTVVINADDDFTEQISVFIDCIKLIINTGIEELGIKPFAELEFAGDNYTLNEEMIEGRFNFKNIVIKGLSDFDMTATISDDLKIMFQLQLHGVSLSTLYDISGRFFNLANLNGTGIIDFSFAMDFDGVVVLDISEESVAIDDFQMFPTIDPKFEITGLSVGERMSKIISKQMKAIIVSIINMKEFREAFNDVIGPVSLMFFNRDIELRMGLLEIIEIIAKKCNFVRDFHRLISLHVQRRKEVKTDL